MARKIDFLAFEAELKRASKDSGLQHELEQAGFTCVRRSEAYIAKKRGINSLLDLRLTAVAYATSCFGEFSGKFHMPLDSLLFSQLCDKYNSALSEELAQAIFVHGKKALFTPYYGGTWADSELVEFIKKNEKKPSRLLRGNVFAKKFVFSYCIAIPKS